MHLVAWDEVCKPKKSGGLGLRHARLQNQAYLMKLGWGLIQQRDKLWARVVRGKYMCGSDLLPHINSERPGSNAWNGIKSVWNRVLECTEPAPNGSEVRWKGEKSGLFTVKSAYEHSTKIAGDHNRKWEWVWKLKIPQRCRFFMWLVMRRALLTNASRKKKGLGNDESCGICKAEVEDILHIIRDCPGTAELWMTLVHPKARKRFFELDLQDWIWWNIHKKGIAKVPNWKCVFSVICRWLWQRRNLYIFEQKSIANTVIIAGSKAMVESLTGSASRLRLLEKGGLREGGSCNHWQLPRNGWVKVNVDGAYSVNSDVAASGGVIRDSTGIMLLCFLFRLQRGDSLSAEVWGCVHGLKLAWDAGYRRVVLESDATEAIQLIRNGCSSHHVDYDIVMLARELMDREWEVVLKHVGREHNEVADWLAKKGLAADIGLHVVTTPPKDLEAILSKDSFSLGAA